ncbi:MAG TPA: SAM-dependent chlorinase/fluorinase [Gemmatimonadaceae bacterium]|nr:SAM-dependent chlorinase/fluorinase [Gemmatimonadaceae bacterium]
MSIITLLTDFGTADGYVGEVQGVLLSLVPAVTLVAIAHDVPAHDVEHARLALARYWRRFPEGTVHLVVVDPGVGTDRAAIAVASEGRFLVGPDNGVLSPALLSGSARVVRLRVPQGAASTFHGRDVFAPAAAALARGEPFETVGRQHDDAIVRRTAAPARLADGSISGEVVTVDRFGNLVTNIAAPRGGVVEIAGRRIGPVARTYGDVPPGTLVAVVGSSGFVEVAQRDGSAARALECGRGSAVILRPNG